MAARVADEHAAVAMILRNPPALYGEIVAIDLIQSAKTHAMLNGNAARFLQKGDNKAPYPAVIPKRCANKYQIVSVRRQSRLATLKVVIVGKRRHD